MGKTLNLIVNLLIPVAGTTIFNVLGEMVKSGANAAIPVSDYDFSLGCALTIVGVAVAQTDIQGAREMFAVFVVVLLALFVFDLILRYRVPGYDVLLIGISNLVALLSTGWAMWRSRG